jgi:hypothetical protein
MESGLLPRCRGEDRYKVLPEGEDLERSMSALDKAARNGGKEPDADRVLAVSIQFTMDPEAAGFWQLCLAHCRALFGAQLTEWECVNRFLEAFFEVFDQKDPLRYAKNHKVIERDGFGCTTPTCTRRGNLHSHHPKRRSQGGPDTMENQTAACYKHHQEGIHEGRIEVEGTAPHNLFWRLGIEKNEEPLLTIGPGEKILERGIFRGNDFRE